MTALERADRIAQSDAFVFAPIAYSILDLQTRQLAANPAFHELFRTDRDLIRVEEITHPEEIERTAAYLATLVSGEEERVVVDKRYLRTDGTVFWGRLTATAVDGPDGRPELLLGMIEDVTGQMDAVAQLTAVSESKSEFVGRVSHDLRTPLHAISGLAELLSNATLDRRHRSFVEAIEREADALCSLVDDLLDLSSIEARRVEVRRSAFALGDCIRDAVRLLGHRADARGLDMGVTVENHAEGHVRGDPDRLRQVLVNLIDNAVKFTSRGSVWVEVRRGAGDQFVIEVRDTGPGIAPEDIERIFEPFAQSHDDQSGTGLGLAISREVAQAMGGSLVVASQPGHGSTFTLSVPLPVAESAAASSTAAIRPTAPESGRPVVLVVEDSPVNRLLVASQLQQLGFDHILAPDGAAALEALEASDVALVLMDWHLPDIDGLEVTRRIRDMEVRRHRRRLPIVAVTARTMSGDRQRCLDAGMDDFLAKPAGLDDLLKVLHTWLGNDGPDHRTHGRPKPPPETSVVDTEAVEQLVDELGDSSIVSTLIRTFLDELPGRRNAIVAGAAAGDLETVRRGAHTLKSTSAALGAARLAAVATELERRTRLGDDDIRPLVTELDELADATATGFADIMEDLAAP